MNAVYTLTLNGKEAYVLSSIDDVDKQNKVYKFVCTKIMDEVAGLQLTSLPVGTKLIELILTKYEPYSSSILASWIMRDCVIYSTNNLFNNLELTVKCGEVISR